MIDTEYDQVNAERRARLRCKRTHRVYPQGVSRAHHSDRWKGMGTMLYLLGVSYRGVEDFLTAIGYPSGHTTVYRDVQETGEEVRKQRQEWLEQVEGVQVVGGDPTSVRCSGTDVVIGVTVDDQRTETLYEWLQPILTWLAPRR